MDGLEPVLKALNQPGIEIVRKRHYHEYGTYFRQADPAKAACATVRMSLSAKMVRLPMSVPPDVGNERNPINGEGD